MCACVHVYMRVYIHVCVCVNSSLPCLRVLYFLLCTASQFPCRPCAQDNTFSEFLSQCLLFPLQHSVCVCVSARPYWLLEPQDVEIGVGGTAEFNCLAKSVPTPQYYWFINGVPLECEWPEDCFVVCVIHRCQEGRLLCGVCDSPLSRRKIGLWCV